MIGREIIEEQKRRQEYGALFSYEGYQLLKRINTFHELDLVLASWGIKLLNENMSIADIYDAICKHLSEQQEHYTLNGLFSSL